MERRILADLHIHSETTNFKSGGKLLLSRYYASSTDMRAGAIWMSHLDTTGWAADRMCFAVNAEDANDAGNPLDKTPQMVLQANGNVGIGTTDPRSKFQVSMGEGDIWTTGTTVADCHMLIGGNEWGGSGTNETLKIGLGYFGSAT